MKNNIKRLITFIIIFTLFFPITKVFATFDEGNSTVFMRIDNGGGCYKFSVGEESETSCGTSRFFVPEDSEVTITAIADENYRFTGWYNFEEEDSDGQGTMVYPLGDRISYDSSYTFTIEADEYKNITPTFAENKGTKSIDYNLELSKIGTKNDEVSTKTDIKKYISNKKDSFTKKIDEFKSGKENVTIPKYDSLFTDNKYAVITEIEFNSAIHDISDDAIILGELDEFDDVNIAEGSVTRHEGYTIYYQEYTLTQVKEEVKTEIQKEIKNEIKSVNLNVVLPKVGDVINVETPGDKNTQKQQATITLPNGVNYILKGNEKTNYMNYYEENSKELFSGKFEKDKKYSMIIWLTTKVNYMFTKDVDIVVNNEKAKLHKYSEDEIGIEYTFTPTIKTKQYTLTNDENSISFIGEANKTYNFSVIDLMTLNDGEIEALEGTRKEVDEIISKVKNAVKDKGTLIGVLSIVVKDGNTEVHEARDGFNIKIKMTDEMKKYDSFKLIYINDNYEVGETVILTRNGDYLEGTIPHLSGYALVSDTKVDDTQQATQLRINNPETGDNLTNYISLLILSIIGTISSLICLRKKQYN